MCSGQWNGRGVLGRMLGGACRHLLGAINIGHASVADPVQSTSVSASWQTACFVAGWLAGRLAGCAASGECIDASWIQSGECIDASWIQSGECIDASWIQSGVPEALCPGSSSLRSGCPAHAYAAHGWLAAWAAAGSASTPPAVGGHACSAWTYWPKILDSVRIYGFQKPGKLAAH